jgi:hypothetical protein
MLGAFVDSSYNYARACKHKIEHRFRRWMQRIFEFLRPWHLGCYGCCGRGYFELCVRHCEVLRVHLNALLATIATFITTETTTATTFVLSLSASASKPPRPRLSPPPRGAFDIELDG